MLGILKLGAWIQSIYMHLFGSVVISACSSSAFTIILHQIIGIPLSHSDLLFVDFYLSCPKKYLITYHIFILTFCELPNYFNHHAIVI